MFDWDRDYEDVVRHKTIRVHKEAAEEQAPSQPWYWQSLASRVVLPLIAAVGVMVAAFMGNQWIGSATATTQISAAVFGTALTSPQPAAITMPDNLQAYDREGFDRFMARMANVSDADLVQYSHATQRDLGDGTGVMAPFHSDVLILTRLEMTRRGLIQASARVTAPAAPAELPALVTVPLAVADNNQPATSPTAALILQATAPLATED